MKRYLSRKELAELLSVSLSKIDKDLVKGLPHKRFGNSVRFDIQEVLKWYEDGAKNEQR